MKPNTLYIPLGIQCLTPNILKYNNIRTNSYPFDWILSNPYFIYKMLYLLLEDGMDINKIVREHFFRNDQKCWFDRKEHYTFRKNGGAICNELYNVVFPHDHYNEVTINKYKTFRKTQKRYFKYFTKNTIYLYQSIIIKLVILL